LGSTDQVSTQNNSKNNQLEKRRLFKQASQARPCDSYQQQQQLKAGREGGTMGHGSSLKFSYDTSKQEDELLSL